MSLLSFSCFSFVLTDPLAKAGGYESLTVSDVIPVQHSRHVTMLPADWLISRQTRVPRKNLNHATSVQLVYDVAHKLCRGRMIFPPKIAPHFHFYGYLQDNF